MSNLYLMVTITDRKREKRFRGLFEEHGADVGFVSFGHGTAVSEILDSFGLEASEKSVMTALVTEDTWKEIRRALRRRMQIDVPGTGIAFLIPPSAVGGKQALNVLLSGQEFIKSEETTLKATDYELLIAIANQGYTEPIMDAARSAGAGGGTVIHAKGTGARKGETFMGISLAAEKEMILIVVKTGTRDAIMRAIMEKAGIGTKAQAIVFSLPVTETAGMRLLEEADEE